MRTYRLQMASVIRSFTCIHYVLRLAKPKLYSKPGFDRFPESKLGLAKGSGFAIPSINDLQEFYHDISQEVTFCLT